MILVLSYFVIEVLAFWAVSSWIGIGSAILLMLALMALGAILAGTQLRRMAHRTVNSPGAMAGNIGLLMVAAVLAPLPGFVSSIFAFLLIFGPTRELVRSALAKSLMHQMEQFGTKLYSNSSMSRAHTTYGSFGDGHEVIEDEDLRKWSQSLDPDDFGPSDNGKGNA